MVAFAPELANEVVYVYLLATELFPAETKIQYHLGQVLKDPLRKYKPAIQAFEAAIQLDAQNLDAYYAIAATYAQWGKSKKAQDALESALENGYAGIGRIQADREWDKLRDKKRFNALLSKYFPGNTE